ncbi:MAG: D-alanyl-D-alanine carboxypeptidase [bacterium]|nr:D-alanyl-D-alanine carboxypeptidase [bacterium]
MKKILICVLCLCTLLYPTQILAKDDVLLESVSGILIEANTGKIIYEKEKDKRVAVASMTKMVAQIIILEQVEAGKIKWSDVVTVSKNASEMGGSQIYLQQGEKITIEDLMRGISMASGNDATVQMAEVISGSEEKFVKLMNQKVKKLGLKNTQFKNCTGLDEEGHYSSAYDMAMIARELVVNHPEILRFSSMYEDYLREDTDNKFWLVNTNKLVRFYEGADGLKTGHTDAAGYCLAATAKRNGLRLIGIVLGVNDSKLRNAQAMELLDYGFNNVKQNVLKEKGSIVKEIKLDKASVDTIDVVLKDDLTVIEDLDGKEHHYTYEIDVSDIKLPASVGTVVGNIKVLENKKVVAQEDLTINKKIMKLSYFDLLFNSLLDIFSGEI